MLEELQNLSNLNHLSISEIGKGLISNENFENAFKFLKRLKYLKELELKFNLRNLNDYNL